MTAALLLALLLASAPAQAAGAVEPAAESPPGPDRRLTLVVELGALPYSGSLDASLRYRLFDAVDAGPVLALGPLFAPIAMPQPAEVGSVSMLRMDVRAGAFLRRVFHPARTIRLAPELQAVWRGSIQYGRVQNPREGIDRTEAFLANHYELQPWFRAEWRFGLVLPWRWADPLGFEAYATTAVGDLHVLWDQLLWGLNVKWTVL